MERRITADADKGGAKADEDPDRVGLVGHRELPGKAFATHAELDVALGLHRLGAALGAAVAHGKLEKDRRAQARRVEAVREVLAPLLEHGVIVVDAAAAKRYASGAPELPAPPPRKRRGALGDATAKTRD